ncbi:phospholipase A1-like [Thrips palmi]|uniref:Phospholipase A1-like n=1 Tax=Thrips palmi TaxID=161013 RepID=A0A6P8YWX1_THRPL|nr:phospholipase A1-like [Thrips palmi]
MRFQLVVVCLCAAAALAVKEDVKKVETLDKAAKKIDAAKDDKKVLLKDGDDEVVKLPDSDKTWGQAINALNPTAEVFSAHLPMYVKSKVKPEIAQAFDLQEELTHWNKEGNPQHLEFIGDDGESAFAVMSSHQPVIFNSYGEDIMFHLFTKADESDLKGYVINDFKTLVDEGGFDPKLPVKVIIHGFTNSIRSPAIQLIKNALLESGKYNVIGVDWGRLCRGPWYPGARAHVSGTGAKVAEFLDALVDLQLTRPEDVHLIGHSLGAHVAGIAGKSMTKGKLARITGLDPAGPLFQLTDNNGILYRGDADLVDIIHTNAGYLGKTMHLGNVDFYPNGGHFQPGCPFDVTGACSHGRAYEVFASTIKNSDAVLEGVLCPSLPDGASTCENRLRQHEDVEKAQMGYNVKFNKEGAYFLRTTDKPNFQFSW